MDTGFAGSHSDLLDPLQLEIDTTQSQRDKTVQDPFLSETMVGETVLSDSMVDETFFGHGHGNNATGESMVEDNLFGHKSAACNAIVEYTFFAEDKSGGSESVVRETTMSELWSEGGCKKEGFSPERNNPQSVPMMIPYDESHLWLEYAEDRAELEKILLFEEFFVIMFPAYGRSVLQSSYLCTVLILGLCVWWFGYEL